MSELTPARDGCGAPQTAPEGRGIASWESGLAVEAVAESQGLAAGVDDVGAVGEAVDDGSGQAGFL